MKATSPPPPGKPAEDSPPVSFGRLLGLARPHLRRLLAATALMLLASSIGLAIPKLAGDVVDSALEKATTTELRQVVGGLIILFAALGLVGFGESYLLGSAGARLLRGLRAQLFDKLVGLSPGFYDQRRVGELLSRLVSDLGVVKSALTSQIPGGLQAAARLLGTGVILFVLQPKLTFVALLVVPPVVIIAMFFGIRLEKISKRARDETAELSALAEETLSGIRTIQAHHAESSRIERYGGQLSELLGVQLHNVRLSAAFGGAVTFAAFSSFALVLGYGGELMVRGELTAGALTSFLLYTFSVAISVGQLGGLYAGYRELKGASARLFEILDTNSEVKDPEGAEPFRLERGDLLVEAVHHTYAGSDKPSLEEISLDIHAGQLIALVGPSGSGKSTLFSLLLRFYDPTSGTIRLDGRELDTIPLRDLRQSIGVVPQEVFLFSGTIAENLRLGAPEATDQQLREAAEAAGASEFIEALDGQDGTSGFDMQVGERGVRLSAGQRQRLAIARAFLANPKLLLLDEATSSLDPDSESIVQAAMHRLFEGRTTLVIAHRLATARRADILHVLDGGRITASGTHDELFATSELYRRYWELQSLERTTEGSEVEPREPAADA